MTWKGVEGGSGLSGDGSRYVCRTMTKKVKKRVTPSVTTPGDTNLSDATAGW